VILEKGLIEFVRRVDDVPQRSLIAWAADCAEHQEALLSPRNPSAWQGRYRMPNQPERDQTLVKSVIPSVRRWLADGTVDQLIYQHAATTLGVYRSLGVVDSLATAVALAGIEDEQRVVRWRTASVASMAYHAAGGTREERTWQENRLIQYLLGEV